MDHMNYIFQIICHTMKIAYVPWQPHLEGEQKIEDPGRKLHLLIISFCCISTCEQSLEMSRVKLPRKVMRVVQRNTVTFLNLSSTAIKQSHVISHWSWQDFNVFGQVVGFVVWLQQVAPRLEMHWHLYHPTWPKKNRKGMVQKRLVLIRKNSSFAKFTLTLGWNAVRCTSYIIHEKNLTLEGPDGSWVSLGAVAGSTGRPRSKANCAEVSSMNASSLTNPMTQLLKPWRTEPENPPPERWKLRIANYNYV